MKAIILARVSTREQEEGHSIDAQVDRLVQYCERKELEVIKIFKITESSTRGKRKEFHEMIEFAKSQKEKVAVVADAVDRFQRGFKESVMADELLRAQKIELHFMRENMVLNENSRSNEIMQWDYAVMGAKTYVLNISENVRRSNEFKLRNGQWTTKAPVGYLNIEDELTEKKTIIVDPVRSPLVKKAFEMYATGTYSILGITKWLKEHGLTNNTPSGKPLSKSGVHKMLTNSFYYGIMVVKGEEYPHNYPPIIDDWLFNKCKKVLAGHNKKPFKYASKPFVFRGLIKCKKCDCSVFSDKKKDKYTYLKCTEYHGKHGACRVTEDDLLEQVQNVFKRFSVPKKELERLRDRLQKSHDAKKDYHTTALDGIQKEYNTIQIKLDRLLDLRINPKQSITVDEYDRKAHSLKQRQKELEVLQKQYTDADEKFMITVNYLLDLASRASELFESSKVDQKRALLNFTLSNLVLNNKKLEFTLRKPFDAMVSAHDRSDWLGR